jgi:phosphoribosyl 1,2-cyclic phosphodiesterase
MATVHIKTCALRSGSSGNSIFIGSGSTRLLVDAGVCCKTIEQSLSEIGEDAANLDGILVTHEHTDHIAGIGVMMRRYKIPVFANQATWRAMHSVIGAVDDKLVRFLKTGGQTIIGDMALSSFATPHDAAESVGFRVETGHGAVAVFTDVGSLQDNLLQAVTGCQIIFIEANYDHTMLMAGTYPAMLKYRIVGQYGHLSNDDCATAVCRLLQTGTNHFVLSHISKDNNFPELALQTVNSRLQSFGARPGHDLCVGIAQRYQVSETVCL